MLKNVKNRPSFHLKVCKGRAFHQNWALANYNIIKGKAKVVEWGFGEGLFGRREEHVKPMSKAIANKTN